MGTRHSWHVRDMKARNNASFMYEHITTIHPEYQITATSHEEAFKADIVTMDRDPNRRLAREAIRIQEALEGEIVTMPLKKKDLPNHKNITVKAKVKLMNGKTEFNLPNLPGISTTNLKTKMKRN